MNRKLYYVKAQEIFELLYPSKNLIYVWYAFFGNP